MRALLLLLVASCTHDIAVYDGAPVQTARDLDILFVYDNSEGRASFDRMAAQLEDLTKGLAAVDGQLPSLHVGVVTTDMGIRGTRDDFNGFTVGNCNARGDAGRLVTFTAGVDDDYLTDRRGPNGARIRNFESGDLVGELARMTNPALAEAPNGCEYPQPLEAMRRALDPAVNPGFIRPDAMLSIVFLTNEDDCSLARAALLDPNNAALGPMHFRCTREAVVCDEDITEPGRKTNCRPREGSELLVDVAEYTAFLAQYKPDPRDITVAAVAAPREPFAVNDFSVPVLAPSCNGPAGIATPPVRLGAFVDSVGGTIANVCNQQEVYRGLTAPIVATQRTCLPNLRMTDGDNCTVVEIADDIETELAPCTEGAAGACWYTFANAAACPTGDNRGIAIDRRSGAAPTTSRIEARCFVQ